MRFGMLGYNGETILFDWQRMKVYAALTQPLPKSDYHNPITVNPTSQFNKAIPTIKQLSMKYKIRPPWRKWTVYEKCFFGAIDKMTEAEWTDICKVFPENNPSNQLPVMNVTTLDDSDEDKVSKESKTDFADSIDTSEWIIPDELPF